MIKPLNDKVLLEVEGKEEKTAGGIIIPDELQEDTLEGVVSAKGPKVCEEIQIEQKVLFRKHCGTELKKDGKEYLLLSESDIIGVIE